MKDSLAEGGIRTGPWIRGWSLPPTMLSTVEGEAVGVMVDDVAMVDIQTKVQHLEDK